MEPKKNSDRDLPLQYHDFPLQYHDDPELMKGFDPNYNPPAKKRRLSKSFKPKASDTKKWMSQLDLKPVRGTKLESDFFLYWLELKGYPIDDSIDTLLTLKREFISDLKTIIKDSDK